eukprot:281141-Rhodomonas_salina.3
MDNEVLFACSQSDEAVSFYFVVMPQPCVFPASACVPTPRNDGRSAGACVRRHQRDHLQDSRCSHRAHQAPPAGRPLPPSYHPHLHRRPHLLRSAPLCSA